MGKYAVKHVVKGRGKSKKEGFVFNLLAGNGEIIATSQMYASMKSCKSGIASVARNAPIAAVEDQTVEGAHEPNPKFEVYADKGGEFRFRLKAANGQIIAASQGYKTKRSCMNGIKSMGKNADSPIKVVED